MSDLKRHVVEEIHKPARRHYRRRRLLVKGLNDFWQADLVEMIPYAKVNKGFRYILVVINVFSKYLWATPVKSKNAKDITTAMKNILLTTKAPPKNLQTDMGKEFYNKDFKQLMKDFNINHYSSYSNLKASVVERVNRTLKNVMWKQFSLQGNYKWLNILQDIVDKYNSTKHRTTQTRPKDVNAANEQSILKSSYTHAKTIDPRGIKFSKGDYVRISKHREAFKKGYTPNWSNEIFQVKKINLTNPATYLLEDEKGEEILGALYGEELQKVKYPDVYLVEKILRRKGNKVYVKWLGMDNSHNTWLNKNQLEL